MAACHSRYRLVHDMVLNVGGRTLRTDVGAGFSIYLFLLTARLGLGVTSTSRRVQRVRSTRQLARLSTDVYLPSSAMRYRRGGGGEDGPVAH
jgi:hypothetical protein